MARIIKRGEKPNPVFRGTCHSCHCVAEEDEGRLAIQYDRNERLAPIHCPQCNEKMWVYPYNENLGRSIG
jgi:hypothetical protein